MSIDCKSDHADGNYYIQRIEYIGWELKYQYSSRPRQNGRYFADDIFKCISL